MNSNFDRLLGFFVWEGVKWYVKRRLPSQRQILATGLLTGAGAVAVVAIARRAG